MYDKVLTNATKLAGKAQDGIFRHAGKTYTLIFAITKKTQNDYDRRKRFNRNKK